MTTTSVNQNKHLMNADNVNDLTPAGRKAVYGAFWGWYVDMFDVYLPIIVLAPALVYFFSPEISAGQRAIFTSLIFVTTLIGRPVGSMIFGHLGDSIGRKKATVAAVTGFGVITLVMACLPGYQHLGTGAVWLFIALRFVGGVFLGGEYAAANPLAMEHTPPGKRGLYSGIIQSGFPLAFVSISLITFALLQVIPAQGLDSPYVQWGWRLPFVVGALFAFAMAAYFHFQVDESPVWKKPSTVHSPLRMLFSGESGRAFVQVFILMTGMWFMTNAFNAVMPGLLKSRVGLTDSQTSGLLIGVFLILAAGFVVAGMVSQSIGRRPFLIAAGLACATLGTGAFYLLLNARGAGLPTIFLLCAVTGLFVVAPIGCIVAYITERFRTGVRASGYGLGYSLAVVIPSFYAFYQRWLGELMPAPYTILVLVSLGGVLLALGSFLGPETRDVEFHAPS